MAGYTNGESGWRMIIGGGEEDSREDRIEEPKMGSASDAIESDCGLLSLSSCPPSREGGTTHRRLATLGSPESQVLRARR
jgi:hypothetical protein